MDGIARFSGEKRRQYFRFEPFAVHVPAGLRESFRRALLGT